MRPTAISALVIAALLACLAYLQLSSRQTPLPPAIPAVSSCKDPKAGMRRIRGEVGFKDNYSMFRFDVSAEVAISREGWAAWDAPGPPVYSLTLTHGNSKSYLYISWGETETAGVGRPPIDPILAAPPGHFKNHKVLDGKGKQIGEESWGYRDDGERWRRVLVGFLSARYGSEADKDIASYGSVHDRDATLFDQIINSVCTDE
jgi:hypothetical protein